MTRVVFVAGSMRSGTTLLGELLGSAENAVCVGETTLLWRALAHDERCSCGVPASECLLWSHVLEDLAEAGYDDAHLELLQRLTLHHVRTRRLPQMFAAARHPGLDRHPDLADLVAALRLLTASVVRHSNAHTVVETTKFLPGLMLRVLAGPDDLSVVHLLRDARGVAASNASSLRDPRPGQPFGRSVSAAAVTWSVENVLISSLSPRGASYRLVLYERLATQPRSVLDELGSALDLRWPPDVVRDGVAVTRHNHTLVGNPIRLTGQGRVIRVDERWRHELTRAQRVAVALGTAAPRLMSVTIAERRTRHDEEQQSRA